MPIQNRLKCFPLRYLYMSPSPSPSFAAYLHALVRPSSTEKGRSSGLSAAGLSWCGWIVQALEPTQSFICEVIQQCLKFGRKHPAAHIHPIRLPDHKGNSDAGQIREAQMDYYTSKSSLSQPMNVQILPQQQMRRSLSSAKTSRSILWRCPRMLYRGFRAHLWRFF